jgi:pilus assembly protein Flp/PilA
MLTMKGLLEFLQGEEGLTTVEYAIAGGLVAGGLILAFNTLGLNVGDVIRDLHAAIGAIVVS